MISLSDAIAHLERGCAVPLIRTLSADLLTPVGALLRLRSAFGADRDAFLFESVERGESIGRYSYVGVDPAESGSVDAETFRVRARALLRTCAPPELLVGRPRFLGGLVFGLDWDYVRSIEPRLGSAPGPVAHVGLFRDVVAFDHLKQEVLLVHALLPVEASGDAASRPRASRPSPDNAKAGTPAPRSQHEVCYAAGVKALDRLKAALDTPLSGVFLKPTGSTDPHVEPDVACETYAQQVGAAKAYIRSGDVFQVVLSRGFEHKTTADGLTVYRALRMVNPSPYMFYLRTGGRELAGASPEMLCRVEDGIATTHPIAGTRRRGASEAEDRILAADLLQDAKERAEHAMLVDLARNDLGRVAKSGTVRITRHMEVERFSHVMHMVSEVQAELRPDVDAIDALDACFPAGTVSGAPKVRAMELIHDFETRPRGPYAGAVGSVGITGSLDTCITIRSVAVEGGIARWQAGAGIVDDSVPESEADETRAKARAMIRAFQLAEEGA